MSVYSLFLERLSCEKEGLIYLIFWSSFLEVIDIFCGLNDNDSDLVDLTSGGLLKLLVL